MERKLIALQLMLQELDIPLKIDTIDARVMVQKGIYLGQRAGADMNYRYGWYLKGPYCTDLTKDYYKLQEQLEEEPGESEKYNLSANLKDALDSVKPLLQKPDTLPDSVGQADWVELIASLDFALKVQGVSEAKAIEFVSGKKPHLAPFMEDGMRALKSSSLYK